MGEYSSNRQKIYLREFEKSTVKTPSSQIYQNIERKWYRKLPHGHGAHLSQETR